MNRLSFLVPLVVVLVLASSLDVRAEVRAIRRNTEGRRVALVIGNGGYAEVPLKNPVNDARDMAAMLKTMGFDVIHKENADKRTMTEAISEFGARLKDADIRLFFYAGHGLQVNNSNYLLPLGARVASAVDVKYEAVEAGRVLDYMDMAPEGVNVVILDACRNNPYRSLFRSADSGGLASMTGPRGTFIAYATSPGSVAADGSGRNSPYTRQLLTHLKTPGLDIRDAFDRVNLGVLSDTNKSQQPWVTYSITGEVCLAGGLPEKPAAPEAGAGGAADKEVIFWQSVQQSDTIRMYEAYLSQYPGGAFASLARIRVEELGAASFPDTVAGLKIGQEGWVEPEALVLDTNRKLWARLGAKLSRDKDAAHTVLLKRTDKGLIADITRTNHRWKRDDTDTKSLAALDGLVQ